MGLTRRGGGVVVVEAEAKDELPGALTPWPGALSSSSVGTLWEGTV